MKVLSKIVLATAIIAGATVANANVSYGNGAMAGQPYVGVKVGKFKVDADIKDPTAYGVYGGYNFDQNFGAEVEYVGSEDVKDGGVEYNVKTYGVYGTYRYHFNNTPVYLKGKLGVAKAEAEAKSALGSATADDTGLGLGIGLGYAPTANISLEASYDHVASDVDLYTIGASLKF